MKWQWIKETKKRLEHETYLEDLKSGGCISCALIYPNIYYIGMSNLGFQSVFKILRRTPNVLCERAFLPEPQFISFFMDNRNLRTIESQKQLQNFEIIAFSISYEMDFPNVVKILQMSDIPPLSSHRDIDRPLVIAGGAITYLNTECIADFIDVFIMGEGEIVIPDIINIISQNAFKSREMLLNAIAEIPGTYIPFFFKHHYNENGIIVKTENLNPSVKNPVRVINNISEFFNTVILTKDTEFKNMLLMEIMRGCPFNCSFCAVGNAFGSFRLRKANEFFQALDNLPVYTKHIGLIGAAINCHPEIEDILDGLHKRGLFINFSSMRVDNLNEKILDIMLAEGNRTLTIAPECGTDELRLKLNKRIINDDIFRIAESAFKKGISNLRLYFMIGLPDEHENDVRSIAEFLSEVFSIAKKDKKHNIKITASINQFIPKPGTLFSRSAQESINSIEEKIMILKPLINKNIKAAFESPKWAFIQGILARGDRKLTGFLLKSSSSTSFNIWYKHLLNESFNVFNYISKKSDEEIMPWEHIGNLTLKYDK